MGQPREGTRALVAGGTRMILQVGKPSVYAVLTVILAGSLRTASAQQSQTDTSELAKQTQNPVANLITIPFQFNFNGAGDLGQETFFNLNVQPVMPFKLTDDYNVIARTIIPINSAPGPNGTRYSGAGDIQAQLFITP